MSLFMTLLVRDEEDIIDANIRYHLGQGIDHFIVTDNLSRDATPDILNDHARSGVATVVRETENTYAQSRWVSRMAAQAHDMGARWIINSDADEFWVAPGDRTLAQWFASQLLWNCALAPRFDFLCVDDGGEPFWKRMTWRRTRSVNPLGKPLPPKMAHRARSDVTVHQGNHDVDGFRWQRIRRDVLEILHFPLRSRAQYIRKIENGGRAYANNTELPDEVGSTWRRQWDELQRTGTLAFVEENVISDTRLDAMIAAGEVVRDRRLADAMARLT